MQIEAIWMVTMRRDLLAKPQDSRLCRLSRWLQAFFIFVSCLHFYELYSSFVFHLISKLNVLLKMSFFKMEFDRNLAPKLLTTTLRCWILMNKYTLRGTNISHLGKRKIIFKRTLSGDMLVPRRVVSYENRFIDRKSTGPPVGPWPSSMAGVATNIAAAPSLKSFKASIVKQKQAETSQKQEACFSRKRKLPEGCRCFFGNSVGNKILFWMDFQMQRWATMTYHLCIDASPHVASVNLWDVCSGGAFCCSEGLMDAPPEKYLSRHDLSKTTYKNTRWNCCSKFFFETPWAPGHWPFHVCIDAHGQRVGIIHLSTTWTRFHSEWVNEVKTALWNLPAPQRLCICWFCSRLTVHRQHCAWDLSSFQKKKLQSSPINPVWSILVLSLIGWFPQGSGWKC